MKKDEHIRQRISELMDSELDEGQARALLAELRRPQSRAQWDLYHRIGDVLRCEPMAAEPGPGFSSRIAARLEQEPALLAPRRRTAGGLRRWSASLAAVAAASMGFLLAPPLFQPLSGDEAPANLAASDHSADEAPGQTHAALMADASGAAAQAETADYILLHQNANPSLYSTPALVRPAALSSPADQ